MLTHMHTHAHIHIKAHALMVCVCPQVVKQHMQQSLLEKELLYYGYEVFGLAFVDPVSSHSWRTSSSFCFHDEGFDIY